MINEILTYYAIPVLIYYGLSGIYSFYKNDKKEHFQNVWDTEADSWTIRKTIGRKNYIRFQNLFWGIVCLIMGIFILVFVIKE